MIQVYKILNDIDIVEKDKLLTRAQYTATRGHSFKLHKKRSRLNVRANTFSNRVVNTWNILARSTIPHFDLSHLTL